jgi:Uma2 family endonuclease
MAMVQLQLTQIRVPPGHRIELENVSWKEFEAILEELGEHRGTRIAYSHGTLEIMAPLPEYEKPKDIISDLVKILLDESGIDWEPYGSTTFRRQDKAAGIEPDACFYIQNASRMIGAERVDLTIDPPPDLAIEVDVTSQTQVNAYETLQVPEIWRFTNKELQIFIFKNGTYIKSATSLTFPNLPIAEVISRYVQQSLTVGVSRTLRSFRQWVRQQIE